MNCGHTFAHAFESVAGTGVGCEGGVYGNDCACKLAGGGLVASRADSTTGKTLSRLELPVTQQSEWNVERRSDAKGQEERGGRLVHPSHRLGEVAAFDDIPETLVRGVTYHLMQAGQIVGLPAVARGGRRHMGDHRR